MFLAQCAHESAGFTRFHENLNYSAQGLMRTWPSRFPNLEAAAPYARNAEKTANHVYSNRLGNGNEASGDGWRYNGRGCIQLTGRENYRKATDNAMVMANCLYNSPVIPPRKSTGKNTAASTSTIAITGP